jgi:hypothetical protein
MDVMANCVSNDLSASSPVVPLVLSGKSGAESSHANPEIPSFYVESSTESCENGISTIDSALLCAMRDARERHGLLRLEQVMIDFIKEETSGYIEVGGANNSVVYSPSGTIISGKSTSLDGGGRQTSFQRCCLHRLADRFGIVRETNEQGMIRLVKVKESAIPSQLLIDLRPSDYEEQQSDSVRGLTTKLSDTSIGNKPMQKMKIMKRNSSSLGSSSSLKSEKGASSKNNNKSKKWSDKEKAYAEARARIFAESAASGEPVVASDAGRVNGDAKFPAATPERTSSSRSLPTIVAETTATLPSADTDDDRITRNKATYRNRQEEENDPDFQRLSSSASSSLHGYGVSDAYGQQYGYNPQQQHFYPASAGYATYPQQGYAVGGETFYPAPQQQQGRLSVMMRRQDSAVSDAANSKTDVNNLDEFPSLGT